MESQNSDFRTVKKTTLIFFFFWMDLRSFFWASQVVLVVKNPPGDVMRCGFYPWVGNIPWRKARQPTPVFLPGESHGQRNLAGYSAWVIDSQARLKQLGTTINASRTHYPVFSAWI